MAHGPAQADVQSRPNEDLVLYDRIAMRVATGENYYRAAAEKLRDGNYPLKPFVAFRLPKPAIASHPAVAACAALPFPSRGPETMKTLLALLLWCVLLVLCWPLALLALVLWPLAWLVLLPFRLVGITFSALFAFLHALLMLPARLLGWRPRPAAQAMA